MSLSRHAYRHAVQQPAASLLDHVWISDDQLASTFTRFANRQRRYESRVPGPLEARRRLAKRKNTALASVGTSGPPDMGSLFGRNGTGHLKWTSNESQLPISQFDSLNSYSYPPNPPTPPKPPVPSLPDEGSVDMDEFDMSYSWSKSPGDLSRTVRDQILEDELKKYWKVDDIRRLVYDYNLHLKREPAYSQMIFSYMLSHAVHSRQPVVEELIVFLDDPSLNTRGTGNYLSVVEHLILNETTTLSRHEFLRAINRALELGLIPREEVGLIIKAIPRIKLGRSTLRSEHPAELARCYRGMWEAIQGCNVLRFKDLGEGVLHAWLNELAGTKSHKDVLLLARDIIVATHHSPSKDSPWVPGFITQWMSLSTNSVRDDSGFNRDKYNADYIRSLLTLFSPYLASEYLVEVTECLAFSLRGDQYQPLMLKAWRDCLTRIPNVESLLGSRAWVFLKPLRSEIEPTDGSPKPCSSFSKHHQILVRLWMLKSLSKALSEGPLWKHPKSTDSVISELLARFDKITRDWEDRDFLTNLTHGLQDLELPFNGMLMMAADLKTKKRTTRSARRAFQQLEKSESTIADLFTDVYSYNATKRYFSSTFERMIRKIDITTSSFIERGIRIAQNGDEGCLTLLRVLKSHTPLKIALSKAWGEPAEDPTETAVALIRDSEHPDPHACLELIHLLAIALACSKTMTPRRSFKMVYWLYLFLHEHQAPIKAPLIRAMYHCGIVRYQREGLRVSSVRYQFILDRVREVEDPEVVMALMNVPA